mmetsp:Transcript_9959/g.12618  ORF Transcript_9959/g.12618 Transcript_9959/m.12618 type:complete len:181 (+) Transcript_9959:124-666(+)
MNLHHSILTIVLCIASQSSHAFTAISSLSSSTSTRNHNTKHHARNPFIHQSKLTKEDTDTAFSAFAESLDENDDNMFNSSIDDETTWQESLEQLLDPTTPAAKRQIVLSDLLNSNEDIRQDVMTALKDRKIDNLLTPTGKKTPKRNTSRSTSNYSRHHPQHCSCSIQKPNHARRITHSRS